MASEKKESIQVKALRYIGPKDSKQVSWIDGRPIFNKVNNFTVELPIQEAAKAAARCPSIFVVVNGVDAPWDVKKVKSHNVPIKPSPLVAEALKENLKKKMERKKFVQKAIEKQKSKQLYGRNDGMPFPTEIVAKSQLPRLAKARKLDPDTLEVVSTVEGFWISEKDGGSDTGITEASMEEGTEFTDAMEG
ncbi:MAG: hypothetical protein PHC68_00360 [Syntrophorhabdaceae bacterium]|nr:hypothetical protein [Syntrophorhabdaceae bacterium]